MSRTHVRNIVVQIPLIVWTAIALLPFALIGLLGFRDNTGIFANPLGFGGTFHPENFLVAWNGPLGSVGLSQMLGNSLTAFLCALVVNLSLGATAAFFVTRLTGKIRGAYLGMFVLGTVVPTVLILVPMFRIFNELGLLSNGIAIGIVYGILSLPTTVLILHGFFSAFPEELVEAARIDGLGEFAIFVRVVLPLSLGALTTAGLLLAVWVWSETQLAIALLQTAESQTAAVGVLGFQGTFVSQLGPLFAGLSIIMIPVIVLYLAFNRTITKGIALGGVFR